MNTRLLSFLIWTIPGLISAFIYYLIEISLPEHKLDTQIIGFLFMGCISLGLMGYLYSYKFFNIKNSLLRLIGIYAINVSGAYVIFYLLFFSRFIFYWFTTEDISSATYTLFAHIFFGLVFFFPLLMLAGLPSILILYIKNRAKTKEV